mmetsp:Transcript_1081/g.4106  ORF Transcript_1081/g.4106 Transcript_1081/m.4106 type:complete len:220 (-) Transcript_1081:786-1445(-)
MEAGGGGGARRRRRVRVARAPLTLSPSQRRAHRPEHSAAEAAPPRLALSREVLLRGRSLRRHDPLVLVNDPLVLLVVLAGAEESGLEGVDRSKHRRARGTSPPLDDPLLHSPLVLLIRLILLASRALLTASLDLTPPLTRAPLTRARLTRARLRLLQRGGVFGELAEGIPRRVGFVEGVRVPFRVGVGIFEGEMRGQAGGLVSRGRLVLRGRLGGAFRG